MCGVAGFLGLQKLSPKKDKIKKVLNIMKNRGPDSSGHYETNLTKNISLNLLHSRLSVIDPETRSSQPFTDENGALIFNGMIYNFIEVRKKLEKKKIKFQTKSDTEVLLKFLNIYGEDKLSMLDGMWSFAYYNFKKKKLIISRDRFGEKPLYFYKDKKKLLFGSNADYIINLTDQKFKLDKKKLELYLKFGFRNLYNNKDYTSLFKNIYSIKPGTYLEINEKLKFKEKYYWNPLSIKINKKLNYTYEKKKLFVEYKNIIRQQTISDFPVACLLSGGVDSSSIASIAAKYYLKNKLHCFSIKTEDPDYDESKMILKTVKKYKLKHTFVNVKNNNQYNLNILKDIIYQTGDFVPTTSWLMYSHMCRVIKKKKHKVILTGTGGDEIFAGYYSHHLHYLKSILNDKKKFKIKYDEWFKLVTPFIRSKDLKDFNQYKSNINKIDPSKTEYIHIKKYFKTYKNEKTIKTKYFKNFLKNELYKELMFSSLPPQVIATDNISMYHGLESRCPLLSHKLYNLSFSFPGDFLIRKGYNKAIFRDSLNTCVDNEILSNREKIGFFTRIDKFFDFRKKSLQKFILQNSFVNNLINVNSVRKLLLKEQKDNQECHLIFGILNTILLLKKYSNYKNVNI
tara:strand:+ start:2961 stop:4835 length:1875 start_codon:yes stop_codon:yes gene_type:complete